MCLQDASYSLYPAQCGPWHWAGEKSLPNYHSARWHSMAFIALAPVLCTSNHAPLPPFLASCLILPVFPTGLRSSTKTSTASRAKLRLHILSIPCSWHTEHCLYVHWVVIWCLSCFFFGWTLHFSFLRAPECCIFWTVAWRHFKLRQSDASAHNHLGNKH